MEDAPPAATCRARHFDGWAFIFFAVLWALQILWSALRFRHAFTTGSELEALRELARKEFAQDAPGAPAQPGAAAEASNAPLTPRDIQNFVQKAVRQPPLAGAMQKRRHAL